LTLATIAAPPQNQELLKSQRNAILDLLTANGFAPADFTWTTATSIVTSGLTVSRLDHIPSGSYYQFDLRDGKAWTRFAPGEDRAVESRYPGSWGLQLRYCGEWLEYLRRELDAPDKWLDFGGVLGEQPLSNTRFSVEERTEVLARIEAARLFLIEIEPNEDKLGSALARLDYLVEASRQQGRRDWWFLAIGVAASIVWDLALDPGKAQRLLTFLTQTINALMP